MKTISYIDYCALPRIQQIGYSIYSGFFKIIFGIGRFFKGLGLGIYHFFVKLINGLVNVCQCFKAGDIFTKLSFLFLGLGHFKRKQYAKGVIIFALEVLFIVFMIGFGGQALYNFITLGESRPAWFCKSDPNKFYLTQQEAIDAGCLFPTQAAGRLDNSANMMLYGVVTIIVLVAFIIFYFKTVKGTYKLECDSYEGKHIKTFIEEIGDFLNSKFHITLLFLPVLGIIVFTIFPLIDTFLMAFTSYDYAHNFPLDVFDWVGFKNFSSLFNFGGTFGYTFISLFKWTIVWAILATFLNFILGILVATIINRKGIKFKKLWRTCLVLSVAIPQFVSLLAMSQFLNEYGPLTYYIEQWTGQKILFLSNYHIARVMIVTINIWIGIPYTVLSTTGILMNIPADLYESARIDGASPITMYFKITLRYIVFVMGPSLITTFIGNFNNFGVIYLLTGGGPKTGSYYNSQAGYTDLLVTWLYTLCTGNQPRYNLASVIGIAIFVVSATLSLIVYRNSSSFKNEEDFA